VSNQKESSHQAEEMNTELIEDVLKRLQELRHKLLHLHKILLELERENFERQFGRVNSGELLQLLINNPQFAWLRTISALVVELDEALDQDEPATREELLNLFTRAREVLTSPAYEEFHLKYQAALQTKPDVVMAHADVMTLLRQEPKSKSS
jgi:hypothetical protein